MKYAIDRSALNFWSEKEQKLEGAHLLDLGEESLRNPRPLWTPFLGQAMANWFEGVLRREGLAFRSEGGFPDAERVRLIISIDESRFNKAATGIVIIRVKTVDPRGDLEHRQVLGSLMGLGLKREVFGDIRLSEHGGFVAIAVEIKDFILQQWDKAGRERIEVEVLEGELELPPEQGEERRITTASSRIDGVASSGFNLSRSVLQELIKQGKVKRNDLVVTKPDVEVKPGDIISCRGYGRIRIVDSSGTRKGRIAWNIIRYIPHKQRGG